MIRYILRILTVLICLSPFCAFAQTAPVAVQLTVHDAIGPATRDYIVRNLQQAAEQRTQGQPVQLIILQLDTPGGLSVSMRDIIKAILASPIPVVVYVAPSGARAASAGTYILYASHIAAMAPGTNLGAATPVSIGGMPSIEPSKPNNKQKEKPKNDQQAHKRKALNDAIAYIRSLAELRGRNVKWAEQAVREAASLSAKKALRMNVIDLMAKNTKELLYKIHGRRVSVLGQTRVMNTKNMTVTAIDPDWRNRFLSVITNPNVAYMLMLIGIYGLIFEFANPGFVVPGVVGAICLILALYALQLLPISFAGLGLILLGIVFMIAEAFVPSFGALGIGGVIAFVVGSIMLLDRSVPGSYVAWQFIVATAAANILFFILLLGMALKARQRRVVSGQEELLGAVGVVLEDSDTGEAMIRIHSEIWQCRANHPLSKGQEVKVVEVVGLILKVE